MSKKDKIIEVAEYFIKKSQDEVGKDSSKNLNALKLQKLLYYAKAWNLVMNKGDNLFSNHFQAWVYGPVNPEVYQHFKDFNFSEPHPEIKKETFKYITNKEKEVLDMVWNIYGKFDGKYLVNQSPTMVCHVG